MKKISLVLIFVFLFFIGMSQVNALSLGEVSLLLVEHPCSSTEVLKSLRIVAELIRIIKTLVPVVIIITGISSCIKAIMEDEGALKKCVNSLMVKFLIGASIFFIPSILGATFNKIASYKNFKNNYSTCFSCMLDSKYCDRNIGINNNQYNCESLLGNPKSSKSTAYYLQYAFNVMKYLGIVLCLVLTIVDIFKALFSDKPDYKPIVSKTFKRLIYACVIFFLPSIVEVLLKILGVYSKCAIG